MKKSLLIIIPAYNEEASIGDFLDSLMQSEAMEYADILVINDASSDSTAEIVESRQIPVISHPFNLGYGSALQTGYKYAVTKGYQYLIQIDADGQHDSCNIGRIYQKLTSEKATPDLVIGTRFLKESQTFSIPFAKKIAILFFRKVIQFAGKKKISDPTSGLQGMNYPVFEYYSRFGNFDNNYPDANMLVQMALLGYDIQEVPAVMHKRTAGKSMHFGIIEPILYMLIMVFSTVNVCIRNRKAKHKKRWNQIEKKTCF